MDICNYAFCYCFRLLAFSVVTIVGDYFVADICRRSESRRSDYGVVDVVKREEKSTVMMKLMMMMMMIMMKLMPVRRLKTTLSSWMT